MRMRARYTEMLSILESGRAKYTYSKMHGVCRCVATHCWLCRRPCSSMNTASPGATSRTKRNDRLSSATLSEASIHSVPRGVRRSPEHQRADAVRVAEAEDAVADDHGHDRVAAAAAPVDGGQRGEHVRRRDARVPTRCSSEANTFSSTSESEVVLRWRRSSRIRISASSAALVRLPLCAEADAVRGVDVERLRLGGAVAAGRRIAHVADAGVALQLEHVVLLEYIAHQAAALAHAQLAVTRGGGDAGGVLTAVLQHGERVVQALIDGAGTDDADDAAHSAPAPQTRTLPWGTRSAPAMARRPLAMLSP